MLRTKIVCTLGPASDDKATLRAFLEAGMAVARVNFSHGSYDDHVKRIGIVRQLAEEMDRSVAVMADLQGPKLRCGLLPSHQMMLTEGDMVSLVNLHRQVLFDEVGALRDEGVLRKALDQQLRSEKSLRDSRER